MALVVAGGANAALPTVTVLLLRVTGSGAELLLIEAKSKEIGGLPLSRIYFSAVPMPHVVSCEDEEGRYIQKIQEQIAENELFWANYIALPIIEEAEEESVVRGNDECDIENLQNEKESCNDIRGHVKAS